MMRPYRRRSRAIRSAVSVSFGTNALRIGSWLSTDDALEDVSAQIDAVFEPWETAHPPTPSQTPVSRHS